MSAATASDVTASDAKPKGGPGRNPVPEGQKWKPGQSGNPGGFPKLAAEVLKLARQCSPDAIAALHSICTDRKQPAAARVTAANVLLDRAWGKPKEHVQLDAQVDVAVTTEGRLNPAAVAAAIMAKYGMDAWEPPTITSEAKEIGHDAAATPPLPDSGATE